MIIISSDYSTINHPEMTNNFIIRPEKVIQVWDIRENQIGIKFNSEYDRNNQVITMEGKDKNMLAKDFLKLLFGPDKTIMGSQKIK